MYVRLLEVRTRKLIDSPMNSNDCHTNICNPLNGVPMSSIVREEFFALHLFKEQIFTMSEHLERILDRFLKTNRYECCGEFKTEEEKKELGLCDETLKEYKEHHDVNNDWSIDYICKKICCFRHCGGEKAWEEMDTWIKTKENNIQELKKQNTDEAKQKMKDLEKQIQDLEKNRKVLPVVIKKFEEFQATPNNSQRIKFDKISDHLKRFFMTLGNEEKNDETQNDVDYDVNTGKPKWTISFERIIEVYPKARQIIFINEYELTEKVLNSLLNQIKKGNKDKINTIKKVEFLYYNYIESNDDGKPKNHPKFKDADLLRQSKTWKELEEKGWIMICKKNGQTGYQIRLELSQKKKKHEIKL
eukprot:132570_1